MVGSPLEYAPPIWDIHSAFGLARVEGFDRYRCGDGHAMLFAAFPDLRAEIHDQVEEGEKVATRETITGTHNGEFMGIAATSRPVAFKVIDIIGVDEGKIVEHSNVIDPLTLMQQLGAIPA